MVVIARVVTLGAVGVVVVAGVVVLVLQDTGGGAAELTVRVERIEIGVKEMCRCPAASPHCAMSMQVTVLVPTSTIGWYSSECAKRLTQPLTAVLGEV